MMNIFQRINSVMRSVKYVQKDGSVNAPGQNYKAVTHDQLISVARQSLVDNGIVIFPDQKEGEFLVMRDLNAQPQPIKMGLYRGSYNIYFVNMDDPKDRVSVCVEAHASDNGDKAPGKALTYATKSAILKILSLETGENDESREEIKEKGKKISKEQFDQLRVYCISEKNEWTAVGSKMLQAYAIGHLDQLLASQFNEALSRCKKASESL